MLPGTPVMIYRSTDPRRTPAAKQPEPKRRPMSKAKVQVRAFKFTAVVPPEAIPPDLVAPDGQPAGNPCIELELEGTGLIVRATLNGKAVRRAIKVIAEHGADGVAVVVQGSLRPGPSAGVFSLDSAGLSAIPKGKPAEKVEA
jgi:hypothetical protein